MKYMLDTNICIYAMKKKPERVLQRLKSELDNGVCISSITLAELEYGSVLPFGAAAASEYGEIRAYLQSQGTPIGPLDMLIAGHARAEKLILVTNNVREFECVPNLEIENWVDS